MRRRDGWQRRLWGFSVTVWMTFGVLWILGISPIHAGGFFGGPDTDRPWYLTEDSPSDAPVTLAMHSGH